MQYANSGNLLSYLDRNINTLTWRTKLQILRDIADCLHIIHFRGLVHCDIHIENIVLDRHYKGDNYICKAFISDLGFSQSQASGPKPSFVLPFAAPEVFTTGKCTKKSDIYAFGIIMCFIASGDIPFTGRQFLENLVDDIMFGLRPSITMPESAPDAYKKLAESCCDANPNKRPEDGWTLLQHISKLIFEAENDQSDNSVWDTIYYNDAKPLPRLENGSKHSSECRDLPKSGMTCMLYSMLMLIADSYININLSIISETKGFV